MRTAKLVFVAAVLLGLIAGCSDTRWTKEGSSRYADFNITFSTNWLKKGDNSQTSIESVSVKLEATRVGAYMIVAGTGQTEKLVSTATSNSTAEYKFNGDVHELTIYFSDGKSIERTTVRVDQ